MSKLLLVNDDRNQLDDFRITALRAGFKDDDIVAVGDESEANDRIAIESFDIAVVDLQLTPRMLDEGLRVIRNLKRKDRTCREKLECAVCCVVVMSCVVLSTAIAEIPEVLVFTPRAQRSKPLKLTLAGRSP